MSSVSSCLKPLCAGTTTQNWCDDCMKDGDKSQHASYPFTAPREEKEPEAQTAKKEDVLKAALDTSLEVAKRNQEMYYREVKQHAKTQKALEAALEASTRYKELYYGREERRKREEEEERREEEEEENERFWEEYERREEEEEEEDTKHEVYNYTDERQGEAREYCGQPGTFYQTYGNGGGSGGYGGFWVREGGKAIWEVAGDDFAYLNGFTFECLPETKEIRVFKSS